MPKTQKFTTFTSLHREKYGSWAGNQHGSPPLPGLCCVEVLPPGRGMIFAQCGKARGFGLEGAYCKTHDPATIKAKQDAASAVYRAKWAADDRANLLRQSAPALIEVLQAIADGHTDPRTLAAETLASLDPKVFP